MNVPNTVVTDTGAPLEAGGLDVGLTLLDAAVDRAVDIAVDFGVDFVPALADPDDMAGVDVARLPDALTEADPLERVVLAVLDGAGPGWLHPVAAAAGGLTI